MRTYPYTIDNGHGESITFTGVREGATGPRVEGTGRAQPQVGAPMHVHYFQAESMQVESGLLGYQVLGEGLKYLGPGQRVIWPAGVPHRWWNAGKTELCTSAWVEPADNAEFFLSTLFAATKANGGRPGVFDVAFLTSRYRSESAMLEMPAVVRRVVMPIVYVLGLALGKYDRFKDAPPARAAGTARPGVPAPAVALHG